MSYSVTWYETVIFDWVRTVLSAVDPSIVVWYQEQRLPRQVLPNASILFLSEGNRGGTPEFKAIDIEQVSGKFESNLDEHRRGTFSVTIYGKPGQSSLLKSLAKALDKALWNPEQYDELLTSQGVSVLWNITGSGSAFVARQIGSENQITVDYEFAYRETTVGEVGVIESVDVTQNVST